MSIWIEPETIQNEYELRQKNQNDEARTMTKPKRTENGSVSCIKTEKTHDRTADDLISRASAIDALKAHEDYKGYLRGDFETILNDLPSAQPDYDLSGYSDRLWKAAVERGKIEALAEQRWIPCREALPEEPHGCLVTVWDTNPVTQDEYENILPYFVGWDGEQWNDGEGEQCPFEVIAWMPLPTPYQEEGEE